MNGAQKRTVAATPSFLDKGKAVANGNGNRASSGINSTAHRPSQWHIDDSDASQDDEEEHLDEEEDDEANDSFYIPSKSFAQQLSTVDPSLYQGSGYKKERRCYHGPLPLPLSKNQRRTLTHIIYCFLLFFLDHT